MREPKWEDITVGQFLDLSKLSNTSGIDDIERAERAVAIIFNKTERDISEMKVSDFNKMAAIAPKFLFQKIPGKPVKYIIVNNRKYKIIYNPATLRQRQYVEVMHFGKNPIENMHLILASIVKPVKYGIERKNRAEDHLQISEDMLCAPVCHVYHACVFFCKLYMRLIETTRHFLTNDLMKKGMTAEGAQMLVNSLMKTMDGFTQQHSLLSTNG